MPLTLFNHPKPKCVSQSPSDGAGEVDLSPVVAVWKQRPGLEKLDPLSFTLSRLTDFRARRYAEPITVTPLGSQHYETSADVGLYPDEQSVTIIATARTIYGTAYRFAWVVSTRSALACESALAQISERAASPAPQAQAEIIEYKGAFSHGQTSLAFSLIEHEQALAELSMDGGASQEAILTVCCTIALSIEPLMADLLALDLRDGAADYELARLSHMLDFEQPLSPGSLMVASAHETSSQGSLRVEGYECANGQNSLRVGSESFALLAQHTLGIEQVITGEALGAISPATPDETRSLASIAIEQGEGALVVCDLTAGELNEARE